MDIKILVAAHKKSWLPDDPVYFPLQVGAEGKKDLGLTKDNTGDNISIKNPYFCELTGLYWAWKNLSCDYIGLCHYRRYFAHNGIYTSPSKMKKLIFKRQDYVDILNNYDIILPPKHRIKNKTVKEQYAKSHNIHDLDEAIKIILEKYPDYKDTVNRFFNQNEIYYYNMFVMKKVILTIIAPGYLISFLLWKKGLIFLHTILISQEFMDSSQRGSLMCGSISNI